MAPRFLTILTGRNVPKIGQPREPEPSTINEKTIADFTRVVEQTQREPPADKARPPELMPSSYGQPSRAPRGRAQRRNGGWRGRASAVALSVCPKLSQMTAAARWIAARKFLAVLS